MRDCSTAPTARGTRCIDSFADDEACVARQKFQIVGGRSLSTPPRTRHSAGAAASAAEQEQVRMRLGYTAHGLRSSFMDWVAEAIPGHRLP